MELLIVGLLLYVITHSFPAFQTARAGVVERMGEKPYLGVYSLLSIAGVSLAIVGYQNAGYVYLYTPPAWTTYVGHVLMLGSTLMLVALFVPSNVKRVIRHPMLWAVALWGIAHTLNNGDLASVLLFGTFGVWSVVGVYLLNRRLHPAYGPKQPLWRDGVVLGGGVGLFFALFYSHQYIFGVWPG